MSVGESLKSPFLYGLLMGKLLVVGIFTNMAIEFSRTCLYSICECGRQPNIATFVWPSYGEVVGSVVKAKIAIEFFPYMPIQRL